MSDETQKIVDEEVKRFVEEGYQTAQKVIRENIDDLHAIAKALLEYETLTGDEIRGLMDGQMPLRDTERRRRCRSPAGRADRRQAGKKRPGRGRRPEGGAGAAAGQLSRAAQMKLKGPPPGGPFVCAAVTTPLHPSAVTSRQPWRFCGELLRRL